MTLRPVARRWTVAQLGAREHYAVARALHRRGQLRALFTDAYCSRGGWLLERGPALARSFAARRHPDLPGELVTSFTGAAMLERLRRALAPRRRSCEYEAYVAEGRAFASRVARTLCAEQLDSTRDAFFGYDTGALEVIEMLTGRGVPTVVDQIDPGPVEEALVVEERARWPGWEPDAERIPTVYWDRLRAEWAAAGRVVVNSEWSRHALIREGVPEHKLSVVPLAFEARGATSPPRSVRRGTLRVLWLGSVVLRKGIPYLLEAARRLLDRDIAFIVAGPVCISSGAVAGAPRNVTFMGRLTRDATEATYSAADVFVLPTISDGFALTQLEALAHGVPVIATPNCAAVVTPGVDGLIVPAGDGEALAAAIARLDDDRALLAEMASAAPRTAARYSVEQLGQAFAGLLGRDGSTAP